MEFFENLFIEKDSEKQKAITEVYDYLYGEDDEEWLKNAMGDAYMSKEEMDNLLKTGKK